MGTIGHRQTKAMTALARGARQTLQYSAWTPTAGGDYEVAIKALTANIDGQLLTGLHVGPNASASMSAAPARVTPRSAEVAVLTQIEGGDFASLARINAALIQQVLPEVVYPTAMG